MNVKKYHWVLYIIASTIVLSIAVQLYWNYLNYKENQQRVKNEIQISLDNAVENYYSALSKNSFLSITSLKKGKDYNLFKEFWKKDSTTKNKNHIKISSIKVITDNEDEYEKLPKILDSIFIKDSAVSNNFSFKIKDSLNIVNNIQNVFIALTNDKVDFIKLDSLLKKQLSIKNINSDYYFNYYIGDSLVETTKKDSLKNYSLNTNAKSTYLQSKQNLVLYYDTIVLSTLKKSFVGIIISFFLSLVIISTLFYLLKIINQQKELATIKNDLISNITHEFKTPIATVSTAIEAIQNFNVLDNKEKTKKYLSVSDIQLKKLHQMAEKLLETATLDSENLLLKKETSNIVEMTEKLANKYQLLANDKTLYFSTNLKEVFLNIDIFHFENALSNLLDNAIKYGGNLIKIHINSIIKSTEIIISDNGNGIEKNQQEKIFDQFYRVPKGNTHDVKGFGIGLYYSKKIIEKHHGSITLQSNKEQTIFKITIPNE